MCLLFCGNTVLSNRVFELLDIFVRVWWDQLSSGTSKCYMGCKSNLLIMHKAHALCVCTLALLLIDLVFRSELIVMKMSRA